MTRRVLPPGVTTSAVAVRVVLFLLPCAALALALPDVPHPALVVAVLLLLAAPAELRPLWWLVTAASAVWTATALWLARSPD